MDLTRSKTILTKSIKRSLNICSQISDINNMSIENIEINLEDLNRLCDHDGVIPGIVAHKYHQQIINILKHDDPKVKRTTLNILLKIIRNNDDKSFILSVTKIICELLENVSDGLTYESCLGFLADIYKEGFNNILSLDDQMILRDSIIKSFFWTSQNAVYNSLFLLYKIQDSENIISQFYLIKIEEMITKLRTGSGMMNEKLGILICKSILKTLDKLEIHDFENISNSSLDSTLIKMLFQSHITLSAEYYSIMFRLLCKILYFPNKTDAPIYTMLPESYAYIVIQKYQFDIATFLFDNLRRYNVKEISLFGFQLFYLILTIPKSLKKLLNETNQEYWIQFILDVLRNNLYCSESINWCFRVINRIIILNPKLIELTESRFYPNDLALDTLLIQIFYSAKELSPISICASCDILSTLSTYSEKIQNHFLEARIHTIIHNMIARYFVTNTLDKESEYQIRLSTTNAMKSLVLYNLSAKELFYNEEIQYNYAKQFLSSSNLHNHGNESYEESLAAYILFLASLSEYYPIKYDLMQNAQSALQNILLCDRCSGNPSIIEAFQELLIVLSGLENETLFLLEILSVEKCCELASIFLNVYAIQKNALIFLQLNVNKLAKSNILIYVGETIFRAVKIFENSSIIKAEACVLIQIYIKKYPEFTVVCVHLNLEKFLFETICLNHNEELVMISLQAFYVLIESSEIREKIVIKAVKECNLLLLQCIIAVGSNLSKISNEILLNAVQQKNETLSYNLTLFLINNGCKPNPYLLKSSFQANNYSSAYLLLRLHGIHDSDEGYLINWSDLNMKNFNISWLEDLSKQFPAKFDSNILWLSKRVKAESKNRNILRNHYEMCQNTLNKLFRYPQTQMRTLDKDIGGFTYFTRLKDGMPTRISNKGKRVYSNMPIISLQLPILDQSETADLNTLRENTKSNEFDYLNRNSIKNVNKFTYQPVPGEIKEFLSVFRCGMDYYYHPLDPRCILEKQNRDEIDCNTCQIIHDFPESSLQFSIKIVKSEEYSENSFVEQLTEIQDSSDSEIKHDINKICFLNLSKNKLTDLKDFVFTLNESKFSKVFQFLTTLKLEKNSINLIPESAFRYMNMLESLDLSENKLKVIPWFIFKFCPLKYLNLNKNEIEMFHLSTSEKRDLILHNKVIYLTQLLLSDNNFKQFDFDLFSIFTELHLLEINCIGINVTENKYLPISQLRNISMKRNSLINISENFLKLSKNIESLNFSENLLATTEMSLSINLSKFENLVSVDLSHNNLACSGPYFIPICILKMPNLQVIDMSYNNITEFPPCHMWTSKKLREMNFSNNKIQNVNLLNAKTNFQNLNILDLSFNLIKRIPPEIGHLSKLTLLNISENPKIKSLPDEIGLLRFKNLNSLVKDGVHLNIPKYINQNAQVRELLKYYYDRLNQSVEYNEIKLVILGLKSSGKTSLLNSLQGKKCKIKTSSGSSNFEVSSWKFQFRQLDRTSEYQFICWDITNKEDLNSFHECYLSQRAVYIIVFDMKKEIEELNSLRPLLWNLKSQAPRSPIIIVGTHLDVLQNQKSSRCSFLSNHLKKICITPGLPKISEIEFVDSRNPNPSITALKNKIGIVLTNHRFINDQTLIEKQPSYYLKLSEILKESLKSLPVNCSILTEKEVKNLLIKHKININDNELKLAVQFLHDSGIIVHFNDTLENLDSLYFLKPQWICLMIAKTLSMTELNSFTHNGIITLTDFLILFEKNIASLLSGDTTNKIHVIQCLKVLEKYNIVFQSSNNELIIPSKLPINPPKTISEFLNSSRICRIYEFLFLPTGFWPRLLTKISVLSKSFDYLFDVFKLKLNSWRTGVIISMEQSIHLILEGKQAVENNKEIIEVSVTRSELGIKILVHIIDCIEVIIDEWYPGLTDDDHQGNKAITCYAVCPDCNTKIPFVDIVKISKKSDFVCEYGHRTSIRIIAPDMVFGDLPNDLLTIPSELEVVKSKENIIGLGGNGCVYKGFYKGNNCAVKYINSFDHPNEQPSFRLLRQEIDILRRFQHPSIISLLAVDCEKIVLEFAPMKDLKYILQTYKNLSKCLLQRMAFQVISGIQYLHFNNILYRDIKMQNVLVFSLELSSPINVKIADYGISRELCPFGFVIPQGTPGYQAPEVLERSTSYKLPADIYSFGILLFNIATRGRHPADLKSHWRAGKQIELISEEQSKIWPRMQECINKCTYLVPEDRPSAEEISNFIRCPTFVSINSILPLTQQTRIECMVSMINSNNTLDVFIANGNQVKQEVRCIDIISGHSKGKPFLQENNSNRILSMMVFSNVIFLGTLNGELWIYDHKENKIISSSIKFQDSIISMLLINAPDKSMILMFGLISGIIHYKLNFTSIFDINISDFEKIKLTEAPVTNLHLASDLIFATSGSEIYKIIFNQVKGNFDYNKVFELDANKQDRLIKCFHCFTENINGHLTVQFYFTIRNDCLIYNYDDQGNQLKPEINCKKLIKEKLGIDTETYSTRIMCLAIWSGCRYICAGTGNGYLVIIDQKINYNLILSLFKNPIITAQVCKLCDNHNKLDKEINKEESNSKYEVIDKLSNLNDESLKIHNQNTSLLVVGNGYKSIGEDNFKGAVLIALSVDISKVSQRLDEHIKSRNDIL